MDAIILLGGPGAGKGTLAEALVKKTDYIHVSTGDMFRAAIQAGTPVGLEAKAFIDRGELVPDSVVLGVIKERIQQEPESARFMFDGFPRTLEQARGLNSLFEEINASVEHVFNLAVPEKQLVSRLSGRRVCKTCGAVYHVVNRPSEKEGICDVDGGPLYQRADDCEATILNRLNVYGEQTAPLISFYRESGLLREIDAGGTMADTLNAVLDILNS